MRPDLAARVEDLLAEGRVRDALALVAESPDLRHAALPPVSKATMAELAASPTAVAAFVEGLASVSPSVRRFAKKLVPKLGDVGELLLAHVVEAVDPFRPADDERPGLAGAFGGFASPVGLAIVDGSMSIVIREPFVYSEAARYAREAGGAMVGALTATNFALVPVLRELVEGPSRAGLTGLAVPATPAFEAAAPADVDALAVQLLGAVWDGLADIWWQQARKGQPALVDAALAWTRGATFAADPRFDGNRVVVALRSRFAAPEWTASDTCGGMRYRASELLRVLPKTPRVRLRAAIEEVRPELTDEQFRWVRRDIDDYDRLYPGETAVAATAEVAAFGIEPPAEALTTELLLDALESVEHVLEHDAASAAVRDAGLDATAVLAAARDTLGSTSMTEARLAEAAWIGPMLDLLVAAARPFAAALAERRAVGGVPDPSTDYDAAREFHFAVLGALEPLAVAAGLLLPAERLDAWAAFWNREVGAYPGFFEIWRQLADVRAARGIPAVAFFRSWLTTGAPQPNGNEYWQAIVARFYRRPEPESHALAREAVASVPLPTGSEYYKRHDWNAPGQWTIGAAWRRRDVALLASACERCALPVYRKGERSFVPLMDTYREDPIYAPSTRETESSVSVGEIWSLVRTEASDRVPTILANMLRVAEFEESARAMLRAASDVSADALVPFAAEVVELAESSEPAVAALGLTIAERLADALGDHAESAVDSASRWSASTSSAAAKAAISALGAFGGQPDALGETAAAALCEALYGETPAVLEHTLKTLKRVAPERVGDTARARVRELAGADPRRYAKLAKAIGVL